MMNKVIKECPVHREASWLHEGATRWKKWMTDGAESIISYIILSDDFMQPILKRAAEKKKRERTGATVLTT